MLDSILESLHVVALPTKTNFRSVQVREVALFEGPEGWGEFSPFLEYGAEECVPWLASAIESVNLVPPSLNRDMIEINATLPAINGRENIAQVLSWFPGCRVAKIKVGEDFNQDLTRIKLAQEIIPGLEIRLDVNGQWTTSQALQYLRDIYAQVSNIQYVEQPCATLEELRELKRSLDVPILIAGDEVIRKARDPFSLDLEAAVDIVMLKVAPLGGIKRSLALAKFYGLPVVVSSALDSAVGISRGLQLAGALPELSYACGLGTGALLEADVSDLAIIAGEIEIVTVKPSIQALKKYGATPNRVEWWKARIKQTWLVGAERGEW